MRLCLPQHAPTLSRLIVLIGISFLIISGVGYRILSTQTSLDLVEYTPHSDTLALGHPTFEDVREYERALPQHRVLTFATTAPQRYVFFPWEAWGTGWNNVFQEQLLNTHLAYLANRGYVFVDYIARDHPPFPDTLPNGTRHMLHIPMNAFTSGPIGGGSWGAAGDASVPRPISQRWWDAVCPPEKVVEVHMGETMRELNIVDETLGDERLRRWASKLRAMPDECVAVIGGTPFNFAFINIGKVLPVWNSYGTSPTLKEHAWSALITRALSRNFALFSPDPAPAALSPALSRIPTTPGAGDPRTPYPLVAFRPYHAAEPPIPGLLALHLRRGDYVEHCANLAIWGSEYNVWNKFSNTSLPNPDPKSAYPLLPDHLSVPAGMSRHNASYAHCWPTPDAILEKVRAVRAEAAAAGQKLITVYMATNGEAVWVGEIADRLRAEGWALVGSSLDMQLARDEQAVSQAVDMGVLVAAETFIGNGFSSVTSNVVQFRLAGGRHVNTNRFW